MTLAGSFSNHDAIVEHPQEIIQIRTHAPARELFLNFSENIIYFNFTLHSHQQTAALSETNGNRGLLHFILVSYYIKSFPEIHNEFILPLIVATVHGKKFLVAVPIFWFEKKQSAVIEHTADILKM